MSSSSSSSLPSSPNTSVDAEFFDADEEAVVTVAIAAVHVSPNSDPHAALVASSPSTSSSQTREEQLKGQQLRSENSGPSSSSSSRTLSQTTASDGDGDDDDGGDAKDQRFEERGDDEQHAQGRGGVDCEDEDEDKSEDVPPVSKPRLATSPVQQQQVRDKKTKNNRGAVRSTSKLQTISLFPDEHLLTVPLSLPPPPSPPPFLPISNL